MSIVSFNTLRREWVAVWRSEAESESPIRPDRAPGCEDGSGQPEIVIVPFIELWILQWNA